MRSDEETFGVVASVLRGLCKDALPGLTPETRIDALPGMDSLKALHAFALVEQRLGVEIDIAVLDHHPECVADIVRAARDAGGRGGTGAG